MWLAYALVRLLTENETVVYHHKFGTFLFLENTVYERISNSVALPQTKHTTFCLIDPDQDRDETNISFMTTADHTFAVVASSPKPSRFKDFRKRKSVPTEFMPLWTEGELKKG
jgi:hypothetical protein